MRVWLNRALAVAVALATISLASAALANVASRYAGRVLIFDKRPPSRWANDGIFHRFVARHKTLSVDENDDGEWRFEYMAFFRRPVGDREVTIRFYDAEDRNGRYLASYTLYLNDPRDRIVGGRATLEQPDFQPNHYYKISVANRGRTLARLTKFAITGEEPERSGEVDFTQDLPSGGDK